MSDGTKCSDINECSDSKLHECHANAVCTNTVEANAKYQLHHNPASYPLRPKPTHGFKL